MKRTQFFTLAAFVHLAFAILSHAAPGDLDTSFAGSGTARFAFGFGDDVAHAAAVQADGKLVVAGSSGLIQFAGGNIAVVRYDTNNLLDSSFGAGGKVITSIPGATNSSVASAVQIQPDGKIVVAGTANDGTNNLFVVVRYNPDASLDESFGVEGIATTRFSDSATANGMVIQTDGKIVVAGFVNDNGGSDFALARYTTKGVLDGTFGIGGEVMTPANGDAVANGVTLQSDGKIIATGTGGGDFAVLRYATNGALDTTFGPAHTGKVFTHLGTSSSSFSTATAVAIEPGDNLQTLDRIVVGGYTDAFSPRQYEVVRYKIDGTLDATLGGSGIVTVAVGAGFFNIANAVVVQGTGTETRKIILAGIANLSDGKDDFCAVRLNDNGTLDNSFGESGKVLSSFASVLDDANAAILLPGGKLLLVGSTLVNQNNDNFALARFNLSDGSLDETFGNGGQITQDIGDRAALAKAVAIQSDGKIVVAGAAINGINYGGTHSIALTRLNPDGGVDMSFGHFGKATATFGETDAGLNAMVIQPDGKIVAAGFSDTNFLVVRYTTNGTPDFSFNGTGFVTTPLDAIGNVANAIALQADGKIVIAGTTLVGADFDILRYNTNGTLDTSFDGDGKLKIDINTGGNQANAVKIQSDGKLIVAGYSIVGGRTVDFSAACV